MTYKERKLIEQELKKLLTSLPHYSPGAYGAMTQREDGKYIRTDELMERIQELPLSDTPFSHYSPALSTDPAKRPPAIKAA